MAEKYDILQWYSHFLKSGDEFSLKKDAKKEIVLFYIQVVFIY